MPTLRLTAITLALSLNLSFAQQPNANPSSAAKESAPQRVTVYSVGPGVSAPETIPSKGPAIPAQSCKRNVNGSVRIFFFVDTTGHPRNLSFTLPLGNDLDKLALRIVGAELFKPAMSGGVPVVVAEIAHVDIHACLVETRDSSNKASYTLKARGVPVRTYESVSNPPADTVLAPGNSLWGDDSSDLANAVEPGGDIVDAVQLNRPELVGIGTAFGRTSGRVCTLSLVVDRNGMPRNIQLVRRVGDQDLETSSILAVSKFRFKPGTRNGEPIPVRTKVIVNFQ